VRPAPDAVRALLSEGFTLVACSIDTIFLRDAARGLVREVGRGARDGK
jgi:hypothetical protein